MTPILSFERFELKYYVPERVVDAIRRFSDSCFALMQPYGALDPPGIPGGCCIWVSY
jgi:hypothetical protein